MSKEAMKLALEALIGARAFLESDAPVEIWGLNDKAITALREALAKPDFWEGYVPEPVKPAQQEPVAYPEGDIVGPCICGSWPGGKCLKCPRITAPAQRTWVGLTDEELSEVYNQADWDTVNGWEYERAIEAKLKEKNT
jgi:hypothetical protein